MLITGRLLGRIRKYTGWVFIWSMRQQSGVGIELV